jgi:predicted Zn-dependent peptidase
MMKKIRSDEGLTYGAYSRLTFPITIPGVFAATFQSKSSTCAYAAELTFELIDGMRTAPPTTDEITTSKNSFIETFPRTFESSTRTANLFAQGELLGRPKAYWEGYRDRVRAVTPQAIKAAMETDLHPEKMIVLVVGNVDEIMQGHPDHDARMTDFGEVTRLPLRDPLTLQPLKE